MKKNVGGIDRIIRILVGIALIAWYLFAEGPIWALIGYYRWQQAYSPYVQLIVYWVLIPVKQNNKSVQYRNALNAFIFIDGLSSQKHPALLLNPRP